MNNFTDKDEQTFLNACAAFKGDIGYGVRLELTQTS